MHRLGADLRYLLVHVSGPLGWRGGPRVVRDCLALAVVVVVGQGRRGLVGLPARDANAILTCRRRSWSLADIFAALTLTLLTTLSTLTRLSWKTAISINVGIAVEQAVEAVDIAVGLAYLVRSLISLSL